MRCSQRMVLVFCGLLASATVSAASMPRYDPEAYCRSVAQVSGGSAVMYSTCIEMEQEAYDNTKAVADQIPSQVMRYCNDVGRAAGGSYVMLETCIEMEVEAASTKPKFKF